MFSDSICRHCRSRDTTLYSLYVAGYLWSDLPAELMAEPNHTLILTIDFKKKRVVFMAEWRTLVSLEAGIERA